MRLCNAKPLCIQQMASAPDGICARRRALQKHWKFIGFLHAPPGRPPGGAPGPVASCPETLKNHWKMKENCWPATRAPPGRPTAPPPDRPRNPWDPLKILKVVRCLVLVYCWFTSGVGLLTVFVNSLAPGGSAAGLSKPTVYKQFTNRVVYKQQQVAWGPRS